MEPDREARAQGPAGVEAAVRVAQAEGVVKAGAKAEAARAEARAVVAASVSQQREARTTSRRPEGCAPRPYGGSLPPALQRLPPAARSLWRTGPADVLVATKSTEDCRHAPDARFNHKL